MSSPSSSSGSKASQPDKLPLASLPKLEIPLPSEPVHSHLAIGDGRSRGGTARTPGTRTPRRVQWAQAVDDDDQARIKNRAKSEEERVLHSLDEKGTDPEAFRTLAQALERHRSSTPSTSPSGHFTQPAPTNYPSYPHTLPPVREKDYFNQQPSPLIIGTGDPSAPTNVDAAEPRADLELHGEVFVDPGERAGLPGPDPETASALVRAHTRRRAFPSLPKVNLRKRSPRSKVGRGNHVDNEEWSGPSDVEFTAGATTARRGGILSALLTLYDQDDQSDAYSTTSGQLSGASTPASARSLSRGRRWARDGNPRRSSSSRRSDNDTLATANQSPVSRSPPAKRFPLPDVGKVLGFDTRPAKERNAAGVFGSLIATTGNIAGAAAPSSNTIAPNLKRPGYHLSRYSYDERPAVQMPQSSLQRSQSMRSLAQPSPGAGSSHATTSPLLRDSPTSIVSPSQPPRPAAIAQSLSEPGHDGPSYRSKWSEVLSLPKRSFNLPQSFPTTPGSIKTLGTTGTEETEDGEWYEKRRPRMSREKDARDEQRRERKRRKKKAEIFITRHIADLLARQTFVCKLARAMMMFGGPTHRLQSQMQSTGRVLEVPLSCMYLPDTMLISFDDEITSTSSVKLIKQGSALDLAKLTHAYKVYWSVIHDEMSVKEASEDLDELMRSRPTYGTLTLIIFGGMASASICSVSFNGSLVDSLISFVLGCMLVAVQLLSARHELYSNVFEITITTVISFVAAALAESQQICYSAVAASSVVLILPGYLVLCGSLELASRSIVSGAVRLCYALIYSLFLGFGLTIGAEMYIKVAHRKSIFGSEDYYCESSHNPDLWYRATPSLWWAFLTVPMFSLFLSLRNHAPLSHLPQLLLISCAGWVTNHYTAIAFPNQNDISSAVGAFVVGFIANIYGRIFRGNAFVVMITGILFQLPSGLANGGLFTFASQSTAGNSSAYLSGFQTALQLISTCIGLTVGLGISLVLVFPIQSRKRAAGVFSL